MVFNYSCQILGIGTDAVSTVDAATKQLQQRYKDSRFSSSLNVWPPYQYQPKHYTTLAFIHNNTKDADVVRFSVTQELAVAGSIKPSQPYKESDLNTNMTKNISDIFSPIEALDGSFVDLHILIEGAPGIGKTVLTKEIAYQWAKNELLASKTLLLLVFLRECSQGQLRSITELLKHVFRNDEMVPYFTNYLLKTEGEDAVIVFDGFDELSEENRKESIVVDIINRTILPKSCLVITSRPTASSSLHKRVDRRVEIVGFTEEDRLDYIQTALEGKNEQVKALQHYLQSNPTINALCYIPLNMTILLCLAENGIDTLPKTQTEMYKKFIEMTIVRFVKKHENHTLPIKIGELPHPHDKLFVELAKLAYKALKTDNIVFTLLKIKKACPHLTMTTSNWNGLGLLKAVQYFSVEIGNDQVTFHFLHFAIQEYMAAWYISTLSQGKQVELLKKKFWSHRYYNTWIMYIGITSGSSFALRHFLSGNRFQFYSKLFKNFEVSSKYLKNKMKCLHLFQCLVEADKEGIIASVKQLFQNNQIDLSNQTLLPSDLNTLGFFLIRSLNKEWDELDLSNCNIGSEGCNVLCDRFLDKDARSIVTIKIVNFSYNQLKLSSLIRLFGLFNYWHTSEIIITDEAILDNATDDKAIEEMILQSSTLTLVLIGLYFFSKNSQPSKVFHVLSNTTNIRIIYLLNCSWKFDSETSELLTLLEKQKLNKVRIIGPSLDKLYIKTMALLLLHNNNYVNMLVYDPTMSDEIADDISSVISNLNENNSGVMLIVSSSKVQGIVNTCTMTNELSAVELFNLNKYVRYFNTKVCSWSENFKGKSFDKENIVGTFVKMVYIIKSDWRLHIAVIENDVLIAHKAKFDNIRKHYNNNISIVYFSSCDVVNKLDYDIVNTSCSVLHSLNSPGCVNLLCNKLLDDQSVPNELFIYGDIEDSLMNSLISHHHPNISAVLVANDVIVGHNPNIQQIALAFQLQPSTTKWVLCGPISAIVFHQVVDALVTLHTHWVELDFTCCNIGDVECEIMHRNLKLMKYSSTVKILNIPFNKLTVSGIYDLVGVIVIWGVQELIINRTNDVLYDYLINNLTSESKNINECSLSITYCNKLICIVCNARWNKIVTKRSSQFTELYIINCDLALLNSKQIINLSLSRLCIINGIVYETIVIEILKLFSNKVVEVSFSNVRITDDDGMIRNLLTSKEFCLDIKLNLLLSTDHWLCVCNATKYQSHFIRHYFINQTQADCYGLHLIRKLEQNRMYVFENDRVNMVCLYTKPHQTTNITHVIAALSYDTSLNTIDIDNYSITSKAVDYLASVIHNNIQLQEIRLNGNNLTIKSTRAVGLHIAILRRFCISNNNITDEAADDIAAVISCNIHLQELNLDTTNLQTSGAIKITRGLQKISTLTKLCFHGNLITDEAADDIAAAISCNTHLQELNLGSNNLQTSGTIKIAKALQKLSSLIKLYINDNNITDEAADDIAAAISHETEELDVSGNNLKTVGVLKIAQSMQRICTLKKLWISNNNITNEAAGTIAAVISCNVLLQELNIASNYFTAAGAIKIARGLQNISTLTKLCFQGNLIADGAADDIAAAISCNVHLEELNLGNNNFTPPGVSKLARSLQKISSLTKLSFHGNCINDNNKIHKMYMCLCDKSIIDNTINDIATVISNNTDLQELNLSSTGLQTLDTIKITRGLQKISTLTKLYIDCNNITDEAADDIGLALSCNGNLQIVNISKNN